MGLFLFPNNSVLFPIALNDGKNAVPLPPKDPEMDDTWSEALITHV